MEITKIPKVTRPIPRKPIKERISPMKRVAQKSVKRGADRETG